MDMQESREALTEMVRELYDEGLITPTGGNLSLRLGEGEGFLITPSAMYKGALKPENMVHLDPSGKPTVKGVRPSIETGMHLKIYEMRPKCNAVIHTHAPTATLFGLLGLTMKPVVIDAIRFLNMPLIPFFMPGTKELVNAVAENITESPALLLQNHGLVTYGSSLRDAANTALALEEVLKLLLECAALGREPVLLPESAVAMLRKFLVG